ncbi:MAG: homocysteine S-methyltransferase family protein [Candidatus Bipolaricaulia bacterium]
MVLKNDQQLTVVDGAIGTEAQKRAPNAEETLTELLNLTQPEVIKNIHRDYLKAGAQVLTTNTFSANEIRLSRSNRGKNLSEINEKGAGLARKAIEDYAGKGEETLVAGSIGPTGETLVPIGDWTFAEFHETFRSQAEALKRGGVDLLIIETMESLREASAALVASNETGLPVIASLSYGDRKRTSYGVVPESGAVTLDFLGADGLGMNCGTGPEPYPDLIKIYNKFTSKPLLAEANAGNPRLEDGVAVYDLSPEKYLEEVKPGLPFLAAVGSCCGSNPDFTKALADIAPDYRSSTTPGTENEKEFISNNSVVIPVSEELEFVEVKVLKDDLKNITEKVVEDRITMLRFSGLSRTEETLERDLSRQFLKLRSSDPIGIVTDDPGLLKTFLTAYPGISPVRATGNKDHLERVAEKYGGRLI